ncbi:MAG: hypothetical protein QM691_10200 [Opitutaceae bacterium]
MSMIDRVLAEPEFGVAPPVLVDVGAAGGIPPSWSRIARHAVVLAFEPDARTTATLTKAQRIFRRWIFASAVVVAETRAPATTEIHLTRSPYCSSTLPLRPDALVKWEFSPLFDVVGSRSCAATTMAQALSKEGLGSPDWIKLDTQGTDYRIFRSLSEGMRQRVLQVEFEPGLIDAYRGEDTLAQVLEGMQDEPFWLSGFEVQQTARARPAGIDAAWYRRLAPAAPGWGNLRYLREVDPPTPELDRRGLLLLWVFATMDGQPAFAYRVADSGQRRFGGTLFREMAGASRRQLRYLMLRRLPRWLWGRLRHRA